MPHYFTGLGDGRVSHKQQQAQQPQLRGGVGGGDEPQQQQHQQEQEDDAYISYLRKTVRERSQPHKPPPGAWGEAAAHYYHHTGQQHNNHQYALDHHPTSIGPWQIAAFALLGAVILLSALFLHILADATTTHSTTNTATTAHPPKDSGHSNSSKQKRRSKRRSLYKKKTDDYWSSDDDTDAEADLLSESVRGQGGYHRTESQEMNETTTLIMNPSFHDPYNPHHPYREQQSRQRKNSLTQQQQQQQQPANGSRNIYQAPAYRYPTPGNRNTTAAAGSFSPSIVHRTVTPALAGPPMPGAAALFSAVSSLESFSNHDSMASVGSHGHHNNTNNSSSNSSSGAAQQQQQQQQQTMLQARPNTLVRSSGQPRKASPTVTIQEPIREEEQTPDPGPRELILPAPAHRDSLIEKTPRVRNGKLIMEAAALAGLPAQTTPSPGRSTSHIQVDSGTAEDSDFVMPFLPNLNASLGSQAQGQQQQLPAPVNMSDLHLYTRMESGTPIEPGNNFWQRPLSPHPLPLPQVVPTPDRLPPSVAPSLPDHPPSLRGDINEHFMEMVDSIDDSESLDSNDPRKNIQHKRSDLLMGTDSAASLQGAVIFEDLQLQEVIGGGGFGQVWKAMWNGTPVAVKVLTGSAQAHHVPRAILEEFAAEINLLKGMRHPNICLYMGACLAPPNRAIITELAANGSLWDALRLPLAAPYTACDGLSRHAWPMSLYQPDPRHGVPPSMMRTVPQVPPKGTWPWILVKKVACGSARGMNYLHSGKPPVL